MYILPSCPGFFVNKVDSCLLVHLVQIRSRNASNTSCYVSSLTNWQKTLLPVIVVLHHPWLGFGVFVETTNGKGKLAYVELSLYLSGQIDDGHTVILHSANLNLRFFEVLQEVCKYSFKKTLILKSHIDDAVLRWTNVNVFIFSVL